MKVQRHFANGRLPAACCLALFTGCVGGLGGAGDRTLEDSLKGIGNRLSGLATRKKAELSQAEFDAKLAKGRNLERAGKYAEARPIYQRLIARYPKRYQPFHRLGVVADHQRRHREAQALYTQAIRLNRRNSELFNDLGYCLYLQGKLEKAESALLKAVAISPAKARYRNNIGLVLGHLGRYDDALEQFRRGGSEADAYYNLAFVRASREESEGAKEDFNSALAADPAHERARRALASLEPNEDDPGDLEGSHPIVVPSRARWVPYVEDSRAEPSGAVEPVSHSTAVYSKGAAAPARSNTQALLKRARTLMSRRMAAQPK